MTPEGRKVWKSPQGVGLLGRVLRGQPLQPEDKETVAKLHALNKIALEKAAAKKK